MTSISDQLIPGVDFYVCGDHIVWDWELWTLDQWIKANQVLDVIKVGTEGLLRLAKEPRGRVISSVPVYPTDAQILKACARVRSGAVTERNRARQRN